MAEDMLAGQPLGAVRQQVLAYGTLELSIHHLKVVLRNFNVDHGSMVRSVSVVAVTAGVLGLRTAF